MGKAAIYNPYLDTLGGGERYTIEFARVLAEEGFDIDIEWSDQNIKNKIQDRFGLKIPNSIRFVTSIDRGQNYDLCFWVSDGSIPTLKAQKNILHFQVPFTDVNGRSLLNKMKLFRIDKIVCNSEFTKKIIDEEFGVTSDVLYPPIDLASFKSKRKENLILYVGRFSKLLQSKGQDILIEEFKKLQEDGFGDWKLVLAGGTEIGSDDTLRNLQKQIDDYPIEILKSPSFVELKDLYGKAKLFWSASGYGVDEGKNPEKVEHFGMTLVESMSAGCVPLVVNKGGHREIIESGVNGYLWDNKEELVQISKEIILGKNLSKLSLKAKETSVKFGRDLFKQTICDKII